ncbi:WYL domain-containing protein [Klebsiella quasipneumoniae]|uniref:WYL domain-containing protein n=2 Tax=Klebsiella pneumoniae complex TaxID=3390273 RepID=UPI00200633D9|nr:WYL domain-containing protein [Klebsiella quasipneumoniae]MCK6040124.1 WYL domain-containing protein [Klebsiella quasipneumoniae]
MLFTSFNDILKEDQTLAIRLAFIDFKVFYTGMLSRIDIMNEFDVSEITASRVISQYREFRGGNISYDNKSKRFELKKDTYEPLVKFNAKDALRMLSEGFDKNYLIRGRGFIPYEPIGFIQPPLENSFVSIITRAIAAGKKIKCQYNSATSNDSSYRVLSPLVILFDGRNWIFRAYHENSTSDVKYKNFNFARVVDVLSDDEFVDYEHGLAYDDLWNITLPVEIEINKSFSDVKKNEVRRDFGIKDGADKVLMTERAAFIWIILNQWMVHYDDGKKMTDDYIFCLKNAEMLRTYKAIR